MLHPLNVLLINEEAQTQIVIFKLLSSPDVAIHTCLGGKEGVAMLPTVHADVIITDFVMSYRSGLEWLMYVREKAANPDSKVIVLSAIQDPETISECRKLGFDAFFSVPFEPGRLLAEVRRCITSPRGSIAKIYPRERRSIVSPSVGIVKIYPVRDIY